ncbi:MAG TPA: primosomal protein N', partial [Ktedonobacteraceae bacterium]
MVLQLAKTGDSASDESVSEQAVSLRLQALVGLLLADGGLDVGKLKKMLGPKRAKELLSEALTSRLVEREAQLTVPRAKKRFQRVVRLLAQGEELATWKQRAEAQIQQNLPSVSAINMAPDNVRRRPTKSKPDPWAIPGTADVLTLMPQDLASLQAQRQLAAIDLLQSDAGSADSPTNNVYWTPNKLRTACKLTPAQFQALVRENIIAIEEIEVRRDPLQGRVIPPSTPLSLTPAQENALAHILETLAPSNGTRQEDIKPILLHGVTGSGKTEVYLQAMAEIITSCKRGIVLVPEIVLTTQAIERFAGRFPGRVAIIHGDLFLGERFDEWQRIRSGQVDVVIGSRSAIFSPLPDLGLIILDEEHESAYKQSDMKPTYHAREAAIALGRILRIPVVLGSATPSVETFYRAEQHEYSLVELPGRIGAELPPVEIIDLRSELHAGNTSIISRRLQSELERVLRNNQQAILFLNRRGAASCVLCRDCGFVVMCDRCDVPLTYHSTERILLCHYCNRQSKVLHACPQCNSSGIRYFGLGTEKVMDTIQRSFPTARLLRWDRDTATNHR